MQCEWVKGFSNEDVAEIRECVERASEYGERVAGAHMRRISIIARMTALLDDAQLSRDDVNGGCPEDL